MPVSCYAKPLKGLIALLLCLLSAVAVAEPVAIGQSFPDFTLPSAYADFGQRLAEQRGKPVMLVLPGRCDRCDQELAPFQLLSAGFALDELVTWVIWTPVRKDQPPRIHLPVLRRTAGWADNAWQEKPTVLLINRDGVLDHVIQERLSRLPDVTRQQLNAWMSAGQRRLPQP